MAKEHTDIVKQIAAALEANHAFDNGVFTTTEDLAKMALEHEGQTIDSAKAVHRARNSVMSGIALALNPLGLKAHEEDKELQSVSFKQDFVGDTASISVARSASYPNLQDRSGPAIIKAGVVDARYIARGTSKKSGQLKVVQEEINQAWKSLL